MRRSFVLFSSALLLLAAIPAVANAATPTPVPTQATTGPVKRWESKDQNLYFEYPAAWKVGANEPRGVLKNEIMNTRVGTAPNTTFLVAVYKLDAPIDLNNDVGMEAFYDQLNATVNEWVSKLPNGTVADVSDISVDDVDGREYSYDYEVNGTLVHADMIILPKDDKAYEITQFANDDEYDNQSDAFDEIFSSLHLPWTPPA